LKNKNNPPDWLKVDAIGVKFDECSQEKVIEL